MSAVVAWTTAGNDLLLRMTIFYLNGRVICIPTPKSFITSDNTYYV
jgi:hypothetical protein